MKIIRITKRCRYIAVRSGGKREKYPNCEPWLAMSGIDAAIGYNLCRANAQWRQLPGTEGSYSFVLCAQGPYIFTGDRAGKLLRSSDNGQTWEVKNNGLPDSSIFITFYNEPGLLLLGTGHGAFRSTDNGESWQAIGINVTTGHVAHHFARLGGLLFMAADSGLAKSLDNGVTWLRSETGMPSARSFQAIAAYGDKLFCGLRFRSVYASIDSGATWQSDTVGLPPRSIYCIGAGKNVIIATTVTGDTYRSNGVDGRWRDISMDLPVHVSLVFDVIVVNDSIIFAASDYGFLVWRFRESSGSCVDLRHARYRSLWPASRDSEAVDGQSGGTR